MTVYLPRDLWYWGGWLVLLTLGCVAIAQVEGCDNCLFGRLYCHTSKQQCMYGCLPGWKGPGCSDRCNVSNCRECVEDQDGTERCTSCTEGLYGPKCDLSCSPNCVRPSDNDVCDQFGHCHFGCRKPYMGTKCLDQNCPFPNCRTCRSGHYGHVYCDVCLTGYYWWNETRCMLCSENCLNGNTDCDPRSGMCPSRLCKAGWFGDRCDRLCDVQNCSQCSVSTGTTVCVECQPGRYPTREGRVCSSCQGQNCQGTCDGQTGDCPMGCLPGYYGQGYKCNLACDISNCVQCRLASNLGPVCVRCTEGHYVDRYGSCVGCSRSCRNGTCDIYSGRCTAGCNEGFHGHRCEYTCGENCVNSRCNETTGACECLEGWFGDRCNRNCPVHCSYCNKYKDGVCDGCEVGHWGKICEKSCNTNCRHSGYGNFLYCDQWTGDCPAGCYDGFYGSSCSATCSSHCESNLCKKDTGDCDSGCSIGWYGKRCDMPCPANCVDVTVGWSRTCSQTEGKCMMGCKPGFYGDYCEKICSDRCKNGRCVEGTGQCAEGCAPGFTGPDCAFSCTVKDCLSECSPNCLQKSCDPHSKECLDGCVQGWYGRNCQEICNSNCQDRKCHQDDGTCMGACLPGYFGAACSFMCNQNCLENNCNKQTGYCTYGCKANFHGPDCSLMCSINCPNSTCDRDTGACTQCGIGHRGNFCEQDCLPGTYGENCKDSCGHCKDYSPCFTTNGWCPSGCESGWTGPGCQQALSQYSEEKETGPSTAVQIAIGCSVGGVFCALILAVAFWVRRKKSWQKQKSEPVVAYSGHAVNIESVHHHSNTVQGVQSEETASQDSNVSIQSQSAMLLGDPDMGSQIRVQQVLYKGDFYTLHKGCVKIRNQDEECCVKYVQLTDLADRGSHLKGLMKESEILSTCGSHINIINLIKTYMNTDVYCIALNNSMQTGLLPYLRRLQTGSTDDNIPPLDALRILQFTIDCCSAVCHLHDLKILHRALQARHVYLSDTLVAKLGNFEYAEIVAMETEEATEVAVEMETLPEEFYPWSAPESFLQNNYSFPTDIWSLGVLFWETFTLGKTPFDGLDTDAHQQAVMDGIRPSKPSLAHFTLYRVMKSCWRYDMEERPRADNLLQQLIDIQGRYANVENIVVHV